MIFGDIAFSSDGKTIATVSQDKTIRLHPVMAVEDLKELARMRLTRQLTSAEKQEFLLND